MELKPNKFGSFKVDTDKINRKSEIDTFKASHVASDTDSGPFSMHHTLGPRRNQASPGNHTHDGSTSKKIFYAGTESISFTTRDFFVTQINFPEPFPSGSSPVVMTNIATGAGNTARWGSRAITITETGFELFVFKGDADGASQAWSNVPVQWFAVLGDN